MTGSCTGSAIASPHPAGFPRLPRINRSIFIPDAGSVRYEIISSEYIEIENIDIAPSKGNFARTIDPASIPFNFSEVYDKDEYFPAELVSIRDPHIVRDFRGAVVEINAFRYNPVKRTLRIYTDLTIEISTSGSGGVNEIARTALPDKIDILSILPASIIPPFWNPAVCW